MSKSSAKDPYHYQGDWINTTGEKMVMVTKAEYDTLKADVLQLRMDVNELQQIASNRGATVDRLRDAVQKLREGL